LVIITRSMKKRKVAVRGRDCYFSEYRLCDYLMKFKNVFQLLIETFAKEKIDYALIGAFALNAYEKYDQMERYYEITGEKQCDQEP
jgi:hypothetical protein